jgi:translation initiation factor 1 (eIF-1/SUI1)
MYTKLFKKSKIQFLEKKLVLKLSSKPTESNDAQTTNIEKQKQHSMESLMKLSNKEKEITLDKTFVDSIKDPNYQEIISTAMNDKLPIIQNFIDISADDLKNIIHGALGKDTLLKTLENWFSQDEEGIKLGTENIPLEGMLEGSNIDPNKLNKVKTILLSFINQIQLDFLSVKQFTEDANEKYGVKLIPMDMNGKVKVAPSMLHLDQNINNLYYTGENDLMIKTLDKKIILQAGNLTDLLHTGIAKLGNGTKKSLVKMGNTYLELPNLGSDKRAGDMLGYQRNSLPTLKDLPMGSEYIRGNLGEFVGVTDEGLFRIIPGKEDAFNNAIDKSDQSLAQTITGSENSRIMPEMESSMFGLIKSEKTAEKAQIEGSKISEDFILTHNAMFRSLDTAKDTMGTEQFNTFITKSKNKGSEILVSINNNPENKNNLSSLAKKYQSALNNGDTAKAGALALQAYLSTRLPVLLNAGKSMTESIQLLANNQDKEIKLQDNELKKYTIEANKAFNILKKSGVQIDQNQKFNFFTNLNLTKHNEVKLPEDTRTLVEHVDQVTRVEEREWKNVGLQREVENYIQNKEPEKVYSTREWEKKLGTTTGQETLANTASSMLQDGSQVITRVFVRPKTTHLAVRKETVYVTEREEVTITEQDQEREVVIYHKVTDTYEVVKYKLEDKKPPTVTFNASMQLANGKNGAFDYSLSAGGSLTTDGRTKHNTVMQGYLSVDGGVQLTEGIRTGVSYNFDPTNIKQPSADRLGLTVNVNDTVSGSLSTNQASITLARVPVGKNWEASLSFSREYATKGIGLSGKLARTENSFQELIKKQKGKITDKQVSEYLKMINLNTSDLPGNVSEHVENSIKLMLANPSIKSELFGKITEIGGSFMKYEKGKTTSVFSVFLKFIISSKFEGYLKSNTLTSQAAEQALSNPIKKLTLSTENKTALKKGDYIDLTKLNILPGYNHGSFNNDKIVIHNNQHQDKVKIDGTRFGYKEIDGNFDSYPKPSVVVEDNGVAKTYNVYFGNAAESIAFGKSKLTSGFGSKTGDLRKVKYGDGLITQEFKNNEVITDIKVGETSGKVRDKLNVTDVKVGTNITNVTPDIIADVSYDVEESNYAQMFVEKRVVVEKTVKDIAPIFRSRIDTLKQYSVLEHLSRQEVIKIPPPPPPKPPKLSGAPGIANQTGENFNIPGLDQEAVGLVGELLSSIPRNDGDTFNVKEVYANAKNLLKYNEKNGNPFDKYIDAVFNSTTLSRAEQSQALGALNVLQEQWNGLVNDAGRIVSKAENTTGVPSGTTIASAIENNLKNKNIVSSTAVNWNGLEGAGKALKTVLDIADRSVNTAESKIASTIYNEMEATLQGGNLNAAITGGAIISGNVTIPPAAKTSYDNYQNAKTEYQTAIDNFQKASGLNPSQKTQLLKIVETKKVELQLAGVKVVEDLGIVKNPERLDQAKVILEKYNKEQLDAINNPISSTEEIQKALKSLTNLYGLPNFTQEHISLINQIEQGGTYSIPIDKKYLIKDYARHILEIHKKNGGINPYRAIENRINNAPISDTEKQNLLSGINGFLGGNVSKYDNFIHYATEISNGTLKSRETKAFLIHSKSLADPTKSAHLVYVNNPDLKFDKQHTIIPTNITTAARELLKVDTAVDARNAVLATFTRDPSKNLASIFLNAQHKGINRNGNFFGNILTNNRPTLTAEQSKKLKIGQKAYTDLWKVSVKIENKRKRKEQVTLQDAQEFAKQAKIISDLEKQKDIAEMMQHYEGGMVDEA